MSLATVVNDGGGGDGGADCLVVAFLVFALTALRPRLLLDAVLAPDALAHANVAARPVAVSDAFHLNLYTRWITQKMGGGESEGVGGGEGGGTERGIHQSL